MQLMVKSMSPQNKDEDEFADDPIRLIDFEQRRTCDMADYQSIDAEIIDLGCELSDEDDCIIQPNTSDSTKQSLSTPLDELNDSKLKNVCVKLVDCYKNPWYFKRYTDRIIENIITAPNCYKFINRSRRPDNVTDRAYTTNNANKALNNNTLISNPWMPLKDDETCRISNKAQRKCRDSKHKEDMEIQKAISQRNSSKIDFKKNEGLVGMKIKKIGFEDNVKNDKKKEVDITKKNNRQKPEEVPCKSHNKAVDMKSSNFEDPKQVPTHVPLLKSSKYKFNAPSPIHLESTKKEKITKEYKSVKDLESTKKEKTTEDKNAKERYQTLQNSESSAEPLNDIELATNPIESYCAPAQLEKKGKENDKFQKMYKDGIKDYSDRKKSAPKPMPRCKKVQIDKTSEMQVDKSHREKKNKGSNKETQQQKQKECEETRTKSSPPQKVVLNNTLIHAYAPLSTNKNTSRTEPNKSFSKLNKLTEKVLKKIQNNFESTNPGRFSEEVQKNDLVKSSIASNELSMSTTIDQDKNKSPVTTTSKTHVSPIAINEAARLSNICASPSGNKRAKDTVFQIKHDLDRKALDGSIDHAKNKSLASKMDAPFNVVHETVQPTDISVDLSGNTYIKDTVSHVSEQVVHVPMQNKDVNSSTNLDEKSRPVNDTHHHGNKKIVTASLHVIDNTGSALTPKNIRKESSPIHGPTLDQNSSSKMPTPQLTSQLQERTQLKQNRKQLLHILSMDKVGNFEDYVKGNFINKMTVSNTSEAKLPETVNHKFPIQTIVTPRCENPSANQENSQTLNLRLQRHTPLNRGSAIIIRPTLMLHPVRHESHKQMYVPQFQRTGPQVIRPVLQQTFLNRPETMKPQVPFQVRPPYLHKNCYQPANSFMSSPHSFASSPNRFALSPDRFTSPPQRFTAPPDRFISPPNRFISPPNRSTSSPKMFISQYPYKPMNLQRSAANYGNMPPGICDVYPNNVHWPHNFSITYGTPPPLLPPTPPPDRTPLNKPATESQGNSSIIGRNNDGLVRKINISAPVTPNKIDVPKTASKVDTVQTKNISEQNTASSRDERLPVITMSSAIVSSKTEMMKELEKAIIPESPVKNKFKRPLPTIKTNENQVLPVKIPKPGPLSKKFKLNSADQNPGQIPKKPAREEASSISGYSPPILPIPTYQNILSKVKAPTVESLFVAVNSEIKGNQNKSPKKRASFEFASELKKDDSKKISLEEYKKRTKTIGSEDKKKHAKLERKIKNTQTNNKKKKCSSKSLSLCDSQSLDTDLGYDSDSTVKLYPILRI